MGQLQTGIDNNELWMADITHIPTWDGVRPHAARFGSLASMGSRGDKFDNAVRESFMASIKTELTKRKTFRPRDEAQLAVFSYIDAFYNPERRHSALGSRSPIEYEKILKENCIETVAV